MPQDRDEGTKGEGGQPHDPGGHGSPPLHIFVNRRKFEESDGVRPKMSGAEIAALVSVPKENAVIRKESGPDQGEIGVDQVIDIKVGDHFLVTRRVVEGGHCAEPRAN